jgi:hypothetical protein
MRNRIGGRQDPPSSRLTSWRMKARTRLLALNTAVTFIPSAAATSSPCQFSHAVSRKASHVCGSTRGLQTPRGCRGIADTQTGDCRHPDSAGSVLGRTKR